jgi:amino-acid N-acetyltransferase
MQIQPAAPRHFNAVRELLSASDLPHDDLTPSHLEHFVVATEGDALAGVVGAELFDDVGLLRSLAVAPSSRGDGVGARLTTAIERYARRQGVTALYLLTMTAAEYFERRGYERIERDSLPDAIQATDEAARLCPSSAICMRTRIDAVSEEQP